MTIQINPDLEKQLEAFAKKTEQPVEVMTNSFLKQAFDLYKNNPSHVTETLSRWSDYEKTGKYVSNEEVKQYLQTLRTK